MTMHDLSSIQEAREIGGKEPGARGRRTGDGFDNRTRLQVRAGLKILAACLIAIVALFGVRGPDAAAGTPKPRAWLPIMSGDPPNWPWAFVGLNLSSIDKYDEVAVAGLKRWNSLNWDPHCNDPFDTTPSKIGLQRRIPVIWGKAQFDDAAQMDELFNGECNDGRPLFFLNEPDLGDEADLTPSTAADMFYKMTRGTWPRKRWQGPIYGGGIIIDHIDWLNQFLDHFATTYNYGSRAIPEIKGWHLHMYANWGGLGGDPPLGALSDEALNRAVDQEKWQLLSFMWERRKEGNTSKIYLDEIGLLIRLNGWVTDGTPAQYSERMAHLLRKQDAMLQTLRPDLEGYEWFEVFASDPYCTKACPWLGFSASNLVYPDGTLTPAGVTWRELAAREQ